MERYRDGDNEMNYLKRMKKVLDSSLRASFKVIT